MEASRNIPEERKGQGQDVYVESMEKSADSKFREIEPWVREGVIIDAGAGAGSVTDRLSLRFPGSKIVAIDSSEDMVERMRRRFFGRENIEVVRADVIDFHRKANTVLHISSNHEVFSSNGYRYEPVIELLKNDYDNLETKGVDIIRDGVQPEPETVFVKPISDFAADRFLKFVHGFKTVRRVDYRIGKADTSLKWHEEKNGKPSIGSLIKMHSQDASELFSKYFYQEANLPVELKEQFGIWTLKEYKEVLKSLGFSIKHAETFLLDYLLNEHYSKDFEIYHLVNDVLSHAPYPPSTMLLVGEK